MALSTTAPKGPEAQGSLLGQLGGALNYVIFSFWLFISYAGFIISMSSVAALQHHENNQGLSAAGPDAPYGGWAIKANFAGLSSGKVFRLDWWILFYQLLVSSLVTLSVLTRVLPQTRISVAGFLSVAIVLDIISADRFLNLTNVIGGTYYHAGRSAFAGFIIAAAADFGLLYHVGLSPAPE